MLLMAGFCACNVINVMLSQLNNCNVISDFDVSDGSIQQ